MKQFQIEDLDLDLNADDSNSDSNLDSNAQDSVLVLDSEGTGGLDYNTEWSVILNEVLPIHRQSDHQLCSLRVVIFILVIHSDIFAFLNSSLHNN